MSQKSDPPVLTGDYALVRDVVLEHRNDFAAYGFELSRVRMTENMRSVECEFIKPQTGMEIWIDFWPARDRRNGGFNVMIVKPIRRTLMVDDYLKLHGRPELSPFFLYRDPTTDVRRFADAFMQMLVGLFDKELRPIIDGTTFEETPIDWQGYK